MKIESNGFDELYNSLDKIQKNAEQLNGTNDIQLENLFTKEFMKHNTNSEDIFKFIESSNLAINNQESFEKIVDSKEWNSYVSSSTKFESWDDMQRNALNKYVSQKLFNDI